MTEVAEPPDIKKRADVRMVQARNSPCLAIKAFSQSGAIGNTVGEDFDGDDAIQTPIASAVHLAHPARTNRREDFIGPESLAR